MIYTSNSPKNTITFACEMAQKAKKGDIICLCGPLGAGKTAFAQGFAKGLGIYEHVSSPTFTIMQLYESGRMPLYHFDLYRLEDAEPEDFDDIGLLDYLEGSGVSLIEWAEYAQDFIPKNATWVEIRRSEDGNLAEKREIHIRGL